MSVETATVPADAKDARVIVVPFDIETTGWRCFEHKTPEGAVQRDVMFSWGATVFNANATQDNECVLEQMQCNLFLGKRNDETWQQLWTRRGFEQRCWDEFWSKNVDVLERTQTRSTHIEYINLASGEPIPLDDIDNNTKNTEGRSVCRDVCAKVNEVGMAMQLNAFLERIEQRYPNAIYVSDTMDYDFRWLSNALEKHGFAPLSYTRDGRYRWWADYIHKKSYAVGRADKSYLDDKDTEVSPAIKAIYARGLEGVKTTHTHLACEDAANIGTDVLAAIRYKRFRVAE